MHTLFALLVCACCTPGTALFSRRVWPNLRVIRVCAVASIRAPVCNHEVFLQNSVVRWPCRCVNEKLIDASWLRAPKVFGCATDSAVTPARPFLFRTYEFPPGAAAEARSAALAVHPGSSKHCIWQAIRASSAAPYYLDDFSIDSLRFQDGAVTVNNPAVCTSAMPFICTSAKESHNDAERLTTSLNMRAQTMLHNYVAQLRVSH